MTNAAITCKEVLYSCLSGAVQYEVVVAGLKQLRNACRPAALAGTYTPTRYDSCIISDIGIDIYVGIWLGVQLLYQRSFLLYFSLLFFASGALDGKRVVGEL